LNQAESNDAALAAAMQADENANADGSQDAKPVLDQSMMKHSDDEKSEKSVKS
jgi:hypothetical protein